jgi:beta-phosphoglucomutase
MIRAMIFDLDGTLVDTEPLHFAAFNETLAPLGIVITREDYYGRLVGYDDRGCFQILLTEHRVSSPTDKIEELIQRKSVVYQQLIEDTELLYPGAFEFVQRCAQRFPLALATGTLAHEAEFILARTGLRESFVEIVAAEHVLSGKPSAAPFLTALERLNEAHGARLTALSARVGEPRPGGKDTIEARQCLVVEDSVAGVAAARAAGMKVLALTHTASRADLADADLICEGFATVDLDQILRTLAARP